MPNPLMYYLFPHTTGNTSFARYRSEEELKPELTYTYQTTNQGISNLKSPLLKQDKQLYKVDTYDDGSLTQQFIDKNGNLQTLTLPQIDVYSEYTPDNQKYKDSYRLLTYNLRQKGFNNWANRLDDIAKSEGVGNALHLHNNMASRVNELRKAKGSTWDDSDIATLTDLAGIPMKLAEILTIFDSGPSWENVSAPKFITTPIKKVNSAANSLTNKIPAVRNYKIAKTISGNLDNTVPKLIPRYQVREWKLEQLPGYMLKSFMQQPSEKLIKNGVISKNGLIDVNQLRALLKNSSSLEKEIVENVLSKHFINQTKIDYSAFRKYMQKELVPYHRRTSLKHEKYGFKNLG